MREYRIYSIHRVYIFRLGLIARVAFIGFSLLPTRVWSGEDWGAKAAPNAGAPSLSTQRFSTFNEETPMFQGLQTSADGRSSSNNTEQILAKLTQILNDNRISRSTFEHTYHVQMSTEDNGRVYYHSIATEPLFSYAHLFEEHIKDRDSPDMPDVSPSILEIGWAPTVFNVNSTSGCILASDLANKLVDSGWILKAKRAINSGDRNAISDNFEKQNKLLFIYHYDYEGSIYNDELSCVHRIVVHFRN